MARLTILVTSPRLPAGLLTGTAWRALHDATLVATYDVQTPFAQALLVDQIDVTTLPDANASVLLDLAATPDANVVWIAGDDGDEDLIRALATDVVDRASTASAGPEIEIMVGSFDPVGARLLDLVEVMDRLRRECPWDQKQTHESLVRYLVEETYETIDAIESGDLDHLREELGDLLLQVMFHSRLATEDPDEPFGIDDVAAGIVEKLVRRHPHVFADGDAETADQVEEAWTTIKAAEKARDSAMDGIPLALPALSLADKVIGRSLKGSVQLSVPAPAESAYTAASLGEVLFALVAAAHAAGIDPEQALRARVAQEIDQVRVHEQRALPDEPRDPS